MSQDAFFGKTQSRISEQKWYTTEAVHVWHSELNLCLWRHYLHLISCLSYIQTIGRLSLNPYLSRFLYVRSVCLFSKYLKIEQYIGFSFKFF